MAVRTETGVPAAADRIVDGLGLPMAAELLPLVGASCGAGDLFVATGASSGSRRASLCPARPRLDVVARSGRRPLVVTAEHRPLALATRRAAGLAPNPVAGDLWAEATAILLRAHRRPGGGRDRRRGRHGPVRAPDLAATGAGVMLPGLTAFPDWLARLG